MMTRTQSRLLVLLSLLLLALLVGSALVLTDRQPVQPIAAVPTQASLPTAAPMTVLATGTPFDPEPQVIALNSTRMQPISDAPPHAAQPVAVLADPTVTTAPPTDVPVEATVASPPASEPVVNVPREPVPQQMVIHFAPNTSEADRAAYIEQLGGQVVDEIAALDTVIVQVADNVTRDAPARSDLVVASEPDYQVSAQIDVPPDDPLYGDQWALQAIGVEAAWAELPADAPAVTVAVIDSGICGGHADLQGRVIDGYDFVNDDADPADDFGHGCAISGIIAANAGNGEGIAGVAPNAQIMPLKVLDASGIGRYSDVAEAIVYAADNGAQIINLSLGGAFESVTLQAAIDYALAADVTVVAAAGNTGGDVLFPARYEPVIAVGAVGRDLAATSFSARGDGVDVWAPGSDITTTSPDGYGTFTGTSFAAPYVAGMAVIQPSGDGAIQLADVDTPLSLGTEALPTNQFAVEYSTDKADLLTSEVRSALVSALDSWIYPNPVDNVFIVNDLRWEENWGIAYVTYRRSQQVDGGEVEYYPYHDGFAVLLAQTETGWRGALDIDVAIYDLVPLIPELVENDTLRQSTFPFYAANVTASTPTLYLPFETAIGGIRVSRTGRRYQDDYNAAGLTGYLSSEYHPGNSDIGLSQNERAAIDFQLSTNRVLAAAGGTVTNETTNCQVVVSHGDGTVAYYIHLSNVQVSAGQTVQRGQYLGNGANACGAEGAHLHFAVWQGGTEIEVRFADAAQQTSNGRTCPATLVCPSLTNYVEFRYTAGSQSQPNVTAWNFANDDQGWGEEHNMWEMGPIDGGTAWMLTGNDPYIHSPYTSFSASEYRYVYIEMAYQAASHNLGQIFFQRSQDGGMWGDRVVYFDAYSMGSYAYGTERYLIDMSRSPNWNGTITRLRIDPIDNVPTDIAWRINRFELLRQPPTSFSVNAGDETDLVATINMANAAGRPTTITINGTESFWFTEAWEQYHALPEITGDVTINGSNVWLKRPQGSPNVRFLEVASGGRLRLNGVNLSNRYITTLNGGAIVNSGRLEIVNAQVEDNFADNATIYSSGSSSSLLVDNVTFVSNEMNDGVGTVWLRNGTTATIRNSRFIDNTAVSNGGAIYVSDDSRLTLTDSIFVNNAAANGGAIYLANASASTVINNNCFVGNSVTSVVNMEAINVDTTNNWWGSADGPSGVGSGHGDSISGNLIYEPFLTTVPSICADTVPDAELAVAISDTPDPVDSGQDVIYTVVVTNNGPEPAIGVRLTVTPPQDAVVDFGAPQQGACTASLQDGYVIGNIQCELGNIASGATVSYNITATTSNTTPATITASAVVTATVNDPNPDNNTATAETTVTSSVCGSGAVNLAATPASINASVNTTFDMVVQVQAGTQTVDGAAAYLNFNPANLEVVNITPGTTLSLALQNTFNNTAGTIDFVAGTLSSPPSGTFDLMTITFRAKAQSSGTGITFNSALPRLSDVTLAGASVLSCAEPAQVTITTGGTLRASVDLQSRPAQPHTRWQVPLAVTISNGGTPVFDDTVTTDTSGQFSIPGLPLGTYDVEVKHSHTLSNMQSVTITAGETTINVGTLREGDANNDNFINLTDFSLLAAAFGRTNGTAGFDSRTDFNMDDIVNLTDFSLLAGNFGQMGGASGQALVSERTVGAQSAVALALDPANTTVGVGETFNVTVQVQAGAQPVDGAAAYLNFDPGTLEVVSVTPGTTFDLVLQNSHDNNSGTVDFVAGTLGTPPTGTFTLMTITVRSLVQADDTTVTFNQVLPRLSDVTRAGDSVLASSTGSTIDVVIPQLDAPVLMTPLNAANPENTNWAFEWQLVTDATAYEIQIGHNNPPTSAPVTVNGTTAAPPTGLMEGATYFWRVRSVNGGDASDWSETRSFTLVSSSRALPLLNHTDSAPTLSWTAITWALNYEIEIATDSRFRDVVVHDAGLSGTTQSFTPTLTPGTYYWRVRALKPDGRWGSWSITETFTIDLP